MKKALFCATAIALALSAGSALAADLPSRKEPAYIPPPPPPMWTGFYVGLNAGGTWSASNSIYSSAYSLYNDNNYGGLYSNLTSGATFASSATGSLSAGGSGGFIGGGQFGYNYQFNPTFVVGFEADIQGVATSNATASAVGAAVAGTLGAVDGTNPVTMIQAHRSLDYLGTVRGRVGYLVTPTLLAYATGGLAYGGVNLSVSYASMDINNTPNPYAPGFGAISLSNTQVGWTVGGGVEWMFMPNWSAKAEYLYYDLGSVQSGTALAGAEFQGSGLLGWAYAPSVSTRFNGHIVRAGVNYHFNWGAPAPVLAKF